MIVWDLFGGSQNSVYQALKDDKRFDIYTFDITKPKRDKQFVVDLSVETYELVDLYKFFRTFQTPDIIVASPLCNSFSIALSMKGGGNCCWKLNEDKSLLIRRSKEEFEKLKGGFTRNQNYDNQKKWADIGECCIINTMFLIDIFKPKYWYIENPKSSLMWKYIQLNWKEFYTHEQPVYYNVCAQGQYGFPTDKKTIICSNVKMNLKDGTLNLKQRARSKYSSGITWGLSQIKDNTQEQGARVKIPPTLIQDIFSYFKE